MLKEAGFQNAVHFETDVTTQVPKGYKKVYICTVKLWGYSLPKLVKKYV